MPADYTINLAKDITSSPQKRSRFYNGMLSYLVACAGALVCVAYFSSINTMKYLKTRQEGLQQLKTTAAITGIPESAFGNPDAMYAGLEQQAIQVASLKKALEQRAQLLPVIRNLLLDLPEGVSLQSLSANRDKMSFGLVMPPPSEEAGDPVKQLRVAWEQSEELMARVASIRPVTGERRRVGSESVFYVQFECVFKQ